MTDLADFMLARIAADEESAWDWLRDDTDADVTIFGVSRVLAECKAKRRIVELHAPVGDADLIAGLICDTCGSGEPYEYPTPWPCHTIKLLAAPYADHAEFEEAWRP